MSARPLRSVQKPAALSNRAGHLHLRFLGAEVACLLLLGILAVVIKGHPGPLPDDVGWELDVQHALLPHQFLTGPIEAVSTLNWPKPAAITMAVVVALFLLLRRWLDAVVVPIAAGISSLATYEISRWVHRPRPSGHGIHVQQVIKSTFSFPSGHVAYAVTVFGLFLFLTFQIRRPVHPALMWTVRVVLIAIILLMPVSRILVGEHWPSDTLAGALDGLFWLILFAHIYNFARSRWPRLLARDER